MSQRALGKKKSSQSVGFFQPPAVGGETHISGRDEDAIRSALYAREKHPIAMLVRLRKEAADSIERLLAFLDATEGDVELADDSDPTLQDIRYAADRTNAVHEDDEECEPSGIADLDGLIEQCGHYSGNTKVRETAGEAAPFGSY